MGEPMDAEGKRKRFWTFLVNKIEIGRWSARIEGHFVIVTITATKTGKVMDHEYLTPITEPMKIDIPPWMFSGKRPDEITAKAVVDQLVELMSLPFEVVPPAPIDIPIHKLPPSKRDKLLKVRQKAQMLDLGPQPQVEESDE